jgi:hypothetical protein
MLSAAMKFAKMGLAPNRIKVRWLGNAQKRWDTHRTTIGNMETYGKEIGVETIQ